MKFVRVGVLFLSFLRELLVTLPSSPHWAHRILLAVVPGLTLVALAAFIIWGDKGLYRHMELKTDLAEANADLAAVQKENQRMLRKLKAMEADERVMERIAGEALNMGVPGGRIIRFESVEEAEAP